MNGRSSRRKGHNFEREVANLFKEIMPGQNIRRGFQMRDGSEAPDVIMPIFWPECKRGKKPNIRAALKQSANDAKKGYIPIAIVKDDREAATVTILLEDFLGIVEEWWNLLGRNH